MNSFSKAMLAGAFALAVPAVASAQACPSYANNGAGLNHTAESVWVPQSVGVIAGGNIDLGACPSVPGHGYIIESPDFTMQYNDLGMGRELEFRVQASCDTVLLINASDAAWYFDDDTNGMDPAIRLSTAPSGQYDIWIGTFGMETCQATLTVESF